MADEKRSFKPNNSISVPGKIILVLLAALVVALLYSGCSASDSSPADDTSKPAAETSQSTNQTQQEWNFKWIRGSDSGEGKITPIILSDKKLLFRFPSRTAEIEVIRTTLESPFFDGQYVKRYDDMSDNVQRVELEAISVNCYIGEQVFRKGQINTWIKIWQPGIDCRK